ncbi:MAG: hypothetical protein ACLSGI_04305 [Butyricicoccaceae bacterium]
MRGERGQALLDALLVTDIGVNMLKQADFRLLVRRNITSRWQP